MLLMTTVINNTSVSCLQRATGDIDRDKLGHKVFNDPMLRRKLNSATHLPVALELIKQMFLQWLGLTSVVVCIALCIIQCRSIFLSTHRL